MAVNHFWRGRGACSEYGRLRAVLLHVPGPQIGGIGCPADILHLKPIAYKILKKEYEGMIKAYRRLGIKIFFIRPRKRVISRELPPNLMYARDLFFMTPQGAIMARMAHEVRRGEVEFAQEALKNAHVHVREKIDSPGTFEGADAVWADNNLLMVGVGQRTNPSGFLQLRRAMKKAGVACEPFHAPRLTQHLLGVVQLVDRDLAFVRSEAADPGMVSFLEARRVGVEEVPEDEEVRERQAMNFVTVGPREVVMPARCPKMRRRLKRRGVRVAAELNTAQLIRGGGGLACATGILWRQPEGDD